MTKSELLKSVSEKVDLSNADVRKVIDCMLDEIVQQLAEGEIVSISGFGRFEMRQRQGKRFTNPKTGAVSTLSEKATPGFKASGKLKLKIKEQDE